MFDSKEFLTFFFPFMFYLPTFSIFTVIQMYATTLYLLQVYHTGILWEREMIMKIRKMHVVQKNFLALEFHLEFHHHAGPKCT